MCPSPWVVTKPLHDNREGTLFSGLNALNLWNKEKKSDIKRKQWSLAFTLIKYYSIPHWHLPFPKELENISNRQLVYQIFRSVLECETSELYKKILNANTRFVGYFVFLNTNLVWWTRFVLLDKIPLFNCSFQTCEDPILVETSVCQRCVIRWILQQTSNHT